MRLKAYWVLFFIPLLVFAAATTLTSSGDWDDSGNWDSGNIADNVSEDVDFNSNIGTVTIRSGFNYTTSNIAMNNGNTLTINGTLNVGNTGTGFTLATGNNTTINVSTGASLTIYGDLDVGNSLTLNVDGTLIIKGDLSMGNDAGLDIQGNVDIDGNFDAGNNASVNIDGDLTVDGDFTAGNGSNMTGSGTASTGGSCTGPAEFCENSPLPVKLVSFTGTVIENQVIVLWTTATEINNNFFQLERSPDGKNFEVIGIVDGNGTTNEQVDYEFKDADPYFGLAYYRLKQVDYDGQFEYFDYILINNESLRKGISATVCPNPTTPDNLNFHFETGDQNSKISTTLYDLSGKIFYQKQFNFQSYEERIKIEPGRIPAGFYLLEVKQGFNKKTIRVKIN